MEKEQILEFRQSIENFTIEELESKANEIRNSISKMILDSDLIIKAAIVEALLKEKKGNK